MFLGAVNLSRIIKSATITSHSTRRD